MGGTLIRGRVVNQKQQPVSGAQVYLARSPVPMADIAQLTDESGGFTLAVPVPGTYRLGIMAEDHRRAEQDVVAGAITVNVVIELQAG